MKNIHEALAKVTNTSIERFYISADNDTQIGFKALVSAVTLPKDVTLYNVDLMRGTVKSQPVNLAIDHIKPGFVEDVKACWYRLVINKLNKDFEPFSTVDDVLNDAEKEILEVVTRRYQDAMDALKAYDKPMETDYTPALFAKAFYNVKASEYDSDITDAFRKIGTALLGLKSEAEAGTGADQVNLKELRVAVNGLCGVIWKEGKSCEKWRFNANAQLARDVYNVVYRGRSIGKNGLVTKIYDNDKAIREIILACLECLQKKAVAGSKLDTGKKADEKTTK